MAQQGSRTADPRGQREVSDASPVEVEDDYQEIELITDSKDPRYTSEMCKQFKRTLSHRNANVHFVGAW